MCATPSRPRSRRGGASNPRAKEDFPGLVGWGDAAHTEGAFAAVGSFLIFVMAFVTPSFLITTPECWVPALGDARHGFPYLSGAGRLVLKDAVMMGAALVTMSDSAKAYLRKRDATKQP